jgi:hypothetical protein
LPLAAGTSVGFVAHTATDPTSVVARGALPLVRGASGDIVSATQTNSPLVPAASRRASGRASGAASATTTRRDHPSERPRERSRQRGDHRRVRPGERPREQSRQRRDRRRSPSLDDAVSAARCAEPPRQSGAPAQAQRIVSLPGPWIARLPDDDRGFIPTDEHGVVAGVEAVWAAGDGTAFPLKQGGLAAQQADAAAASIAAFLGADVEPEPFRPLLRGLLLDPRSARFLDSRHGDLPELALWWPPTKVAAKQLGRYLAPEVPA